MNPEQWMEALCNAKNQSYSELRDALLQDSASLAGFLSKKPLPSDSPMELIHYQIISGWKHNVSLYRKFLSEIESIDFDTEQKKVSGITGVWR